MYWPVFIFDVFQTTRRRACSSQSSPPYPIRRVVRLLREYVLIFVLFAKRPSDHQQRFQNRRR